MTREDILALPAGWELDALVAEKVMGETAHHYYYAQAPDTYSADIAAAWKVVEKMAVTPGCGWPKIEAADFEGKAWKVHFGMHHATAGSVMLAICLAALLAVTENA